MGQWRAGGQGRVRLTIEKMALVAAKFLKVNESHYVVEATIDLVIERVGCVEKLRSL